MKKEAVQLMGRITAGLGFFGCLLIVINMILGGVLAVMGANISEIIGAVFPINLLVGLIGTATFVLGIILIVQLNRHGKPVTSGILLIIAGVFSWIITYVAFVLWIIAGIFLLNIKFDKEELEKESQIF